MLLPREHLIEFRLQFVDVRNLLQEIVLHLRPQIDIPHQQLYNVQSLIDQVVVLQRHLQPPLETPGPYLGPALVQTEQQRIRGLPLLREYAQPVYGRLIQLHELVVLVLLEGELQQIGLVLDQVQMVDNAVQRPIVDLL